MVDLSSALTVPQLQLTLTSFQLIWNIPSQPCWERFGVSLPLSQYGIEHNAQEKFFGEKIALFYNLGDFPRLKREVNGSLSNINGGIPQLGNLTRHLGKTVQDLQSSLPLNFSGLGVVDFEDYRAAFRQNFGLLDVYRNMSRSRVHESHPSWNRGRVDNETALQFNEAAKLFLSGALATAQHWRPAARWGFYHYPYCFATAPGQTVCADTAINGNDQLGWLFDGSQILLPSLYMSHGGTTSADRAGHLIANIQETVRVNKKKRPFFPYMNVKYEDGGFLAKEDLMSTIRLTYEHGGAGVIIWGSSSIVNSAQQCRALRTYVTDVLGPVGRDFRGKTLLDYPVGRVP